MNQPREKVYVTKAGERELTLIGLLGFRVRDRSLEQIGGDLEITSARPATDQEIVLWKGLMRLKNLN